ncbi:hypothetical protein FKM82_020215 [Ascaphus truei]
MASVYHLTVLLLLSSLQWGEALECLTCAPTYCKSLPCSAAQTQCLYVTHYPWYRAPDHTIFRCAEPSECDKYQSKNSVLVVKCCSQDNCNRKYY